MTHQSSKIDIMPLMALGGPVDRLNTLAAELSDGQPALGGTMLLLAAVPLSPSREAFRKAAGEVYDGAHAYRRLRQGRR